MADVFISYANEDRDKAYAICKALEESGISCWIAPRDVPMGDPFIEAIRHAIIDSRAFLVIVSSHSNSSHQVQSEIQTASEKEKPVIPVMIEKIESCDNARFHFAHHAQVDMTERNSQKGIAEIIKIIQHLNYIATESECRDNKTRTRQLGMKGRGFPSFETTQTEEASDPVKPTRKTLDETVHFTLTSPQYIQPGSSFIVDLWAHIDADRDEVLKRARMAASRRELNIKSKGPLKIERGTSIQALLTIDGMLIDQPADSILWTGEIGSASFPVHAPANLQPGSRNGRVELFVNSQRIACINFTIEVRRKAAGIFRQALMMFSRTGPTPVTSLPAEEERHRKAFASYASADRNEVISIIRGMEIQAPSLEVFIDVEKLRPGDDWEHKLMQVIPTYDVFYLFWSYPASKSEWVDKEWRYALKSRGENFIDPVPLDFPDNVPPPAELDSKHFNDKWLYFMKPWIEQNKPG